MAIKVSNGKDIFEVDESRLAEAQKDGFVPTIKVTNGKEEHDVHPSNLNLAEKDGFKIADKKNSARILYENVISPVATALDYTYAPVRQAIAAPAKLARGDFSGALLDPIAQLGRHPNEAPTSAEVMEMYGVPKEKDVSPIAVSNPLFASTYELSPLPDDKDNVKTFPSQQGAAVMDTVMGGEGVNLIAKGTNKVASKIAKGAESLSATISPAASKLKTQQIIEASKKLGIKVTPAMLDDTGFVQRLEYTLAESPSFLGQSVARNRKSVVDKLSNASANLTQDATNLSPYSLGEQFKSGVTAKVGERLDPISAVFNEVRESTKAIPISDKSKEAIIRNIQSLDSYDLTGGAGKPGQYVAMIGRIKNADQVKTLMTMLNQDIKASMGAEKHVLSQIKDKVSSLEKNSITRAAIQAARDGGMRKSTGELIGKEIVNDLRDARTHYRELSTDLQNVAESARIKTNKGPSAFLDSVESIPSEKIQDKFFNVENNRQLMNLRDKFPEQFDLLRKGKLKDIAFEAVDNSKAGRGEVSTQKFLNEVRKLNPEAQQMLFGNSVSTIKDIELVQNSLPPNFNPTGSGTQPGWSDALYRNAKDIPTYLLYKGASSNLAKDATSKMAQLKNIPQINQKYIESSKAMTKPAVLTAQGNGISLRQLAPAISAEKDKPTKGPEKWANDGIEMILKSNEADIDRTTLEKLKETKKGKELLFEASTAKNKKAMENVIRKIRTATNGVE